jgi:hypothetical protein
MLTKGTCGKKGKKKAAITCLGCDSLMKNRAVACWRCGKARLGLLAPASAAKSAMFFPADGRPPFAVKALSAGKPPPAVKPAFTAKAAKSGKASKSARPGPRLTVVKSEADARREAMLAEMYRSADPEMRRWYWMAAHPEFDRDGGQSA